MKVYIILPQRKKEPAQFREKQEVMLMCDDSYEIPGLSESFEDYTPLRGNRPLWTLV